MIDYLNSLSWTRYWMAHIIVALLISAFFVGIEFWVRGAYGGTSAFAGVVFYTGREIRDWEKLHDYDPKGFDYEGFFYPLGACAIAHVLLMVFVR